MSLLNTVQKGKILQPDFLLVYGTDGVGKSTFAAAAPNPIFVGPEKGSASLDVSRIPEVKSLRDVVQVVDELTTTKHEYKTLVIDSIDWLEPLVFSQVCEDSGSQTIGEAYGGWGKGYEAAIRYWLDLMGRISKLRDEKKMGFIGIGHSMVKPFNDPSQNATYDRYQLSLNDKASAKWREFVDCVFFVNYEVYTKTDDKKKTRAYGDGVRVMHTERRPGFDAKNRYGLPETLPLSYDAYAEARLNGEPQGHEQIMKDILVLLEQVTDKELKVKVSEAIEKAGKNSLKLSSCRDRLRTLLSQ